MLFEKIESKGLAQYSYLIGDGTSAVVIDPRRDCDIYADLVRQASMTITAILETHRHEDFAVGSTVLAAKTGATIWHADPQLPYEYGQAAEVGQTWTIGSLTLKALHTPGHTEGSRSYVLYEAGGEAWMVFTGDVLFTGEVGRTDFLGMDRAEEMAGKLYDSIHKQILPLGDGVLLWPGHGYGSACGSTIADRPYSTLGLEKRLNPQLLGVNRETFIKAVANNLPKPRYFEKMEHWNLTGVPPVPVKAGLNALAPLAFQQAMQTVDGAVVLDLRGMTDYMGGHVPGALAISLDKIPSYIGWYVNPEAPLLLVTGDGDDPAKAATYLHRQGFDTIIGYLAGGMDAWLVANLALTETPWVDVRGLCADEAGAYFALDVRSQTEVATGMLPDATVVLHKDLLAHLDEIPRDKTVVAYCTAGPRSTVAVSVLEHRGYTKLGVLRGGVRAWRAAGLSLE